MLRHCNTLIFLKNQLLTTNFQFNLKLTRPDGAGNPFAFWSKRLKEEADIGAQIKNIGFRKLCVWQNFLLFVSATLIFCEYVELSTKIHQFW
jgi:hypothetical protein